MNRTPTGRGAAPAGALLVALFLCVPAPNPGSSRASDATRASYIARIEALERQGRIIEAVSVARAAVEDAERLRIPSAEIVSARIRLADLHVQQSEQWKALQVLEPALARCRGNRIPPLLHGNVFLSMGRAEKNGGLYAASASHYDSALALARQAGGAGRILEARVLISTAHLIRRASAERPRAARLLEQALRILESEREAESSVVVAAQSGLALVLMQLGRAAPAESLLSRSVPATLATLGPDHPEVGLAHSLWGWSQYLLGRHRDSERSFRAALGVYERARRQFDPGTSRRGVKQRVALNLAGALLAQGRGDEAWDVLDSGLSSYIMERLMAKPPRDEAPRPPLSSRQVRSRLQASLDERTAVIGWADVNFVNEPPRDVWGFVIRRSGPVQWVRIAGADSGNGVPDGSGDLRRILIRDSDWPARVYEHEDATEAGRRAWRERFAPLLPHLEGVEHLIVVQGWLGALHPVEAFIDPAGRTLIESFDVTSAASAATYLLLRDRSQRRRATDSPALLVGDATEAGARLRGADAELRRIASTIPGARILPPRDTRDLDRLGTDGALEDYGILHIATHAETDPRYPGAAALILGNDRSGLPALVTADDVERWKLTAKLVTLSGCETTGVIPGYGSGPGLAESFLVAGSASVIVCPLRVDDRAASLLMTRFYEHLASAERPDHGQALRAAKLWLREHVDASGRKPFRNPAYWAGFMYIGARGAARLPS